MSLTAELEFPPADAAARQKAKERLYVLLQVAGWGGLMGLQLFFGGFFQSSAEQKARFAPAVVQAFTGLLLVTHFGRHFIARWGWKSLGWRALVPRVIALGVVEGAVWCSVLWLIQAVVLGWTNPHVSMLVLMSLSWINGSAMAVIWLTFYFSYHLFDRFKRLEIDRVRLTASAKSAELRALKSQLNPHFIFNSLNSLRALIDEDPQRARQAVTQLANLLRYSLQSGQMETVAFEDELKVVKDYLSLEQIRHEERLRVRLDIAEDALQWMVPPMLLQTLVENAVKYGISPLAEGGEIAITARVRGDTLVVNVTNPGRLTPSPAPNGSTGLGLANAAERLRLLLGEKSSLQLRAEGAATVVAEAILPRAAQVFSKAS